MTGSLVMLSALYAGLAALLLYTLVSARIALILRGGLVVLATGAYFLDSICSSYHIASFWGLNT